jgi:hypothetical protein
MMDENGRKPQRLQGFFKKMALEFIHRVCPISKNSWRFSTVKPRKPKF